MEKMFEQMMQGCMGGRQEKGSDPKGCFEQMAAFCPCDGLKELTEADKTALLGMMKSFCGGMAGMPSCAGRGTGSFGS